MLLFKLMFLTNFNFALAVVEISCMFHLKNENVYTCMMLKPAIITPNERIVSINGAHMTNYINSRVYGVSVLYSLHLPRGFSAFFQNLEEYETRDCKVKEISREDFSDLRNLKDLRLDGNELTEIPDDAFLDLTMLTALDLKSNQLVNLPDNLLYNQIHLETLVLAFNELQSLTSTLVENCPKLKSIYLHDNDIKMISPDLILKFPHLKDDYSVSYPCHVSFDDPNFVDAIDEHCNRNCAFTIESAEHFTFAEKSCSEKLLNAIEENEILRTEEKNCVLH